MLSVKSLLIMEGKVGRSLVYIYVYIYIYILVCMQIPQLRHSADSFV